MVWIAPISTTTRYENVLSSRLGNTRQQVQDNLRFAGDAFQIARKLKQQSETTATKEAAFKAIGETVVWQGDGETLNVAEMLAYLCRIRKDDNYPGYGTVETLAKDFPGMDVEALEQAFQKLHLSNYYLGFDSDTKAYWLRPKGEEMIKEIYPDIDLPPKEKRFTTRVRFTSLA